VVRSTPEFRDVRPGWQIDADLGLPGRILIILGQALTDLHCGSPHDRFQVGVVVRFPAEDLNPEIALLELVGVARQRSFHNMPQEARVSLAVLKESVREDSLELIPDGLPVRFRFRFPDFLRRPWLLDPGQIIRSDKKISPSIAPHRLPKYLIFGIPVTGYATTKSPVRTGIGGMGIRWLRTREYCSIVMNAKIGPGGTSKG
jgi:hypothetical protein